MRQAYFICIFFLPCFLGAQILQVTPANPRADDIVSVVFDASKGNKALQGYSGEIYAHTGVILGTVDQPSDWRYVQGEWGKPDERMRMQRIGQDLYQIQFQIRNFYGFSLHEPFLQMAFVFRNENGSLVAKGNEEKDILYPTYKVFEHGPLEKATAKNASSVKHIERMRKLDDGSIFLTDGQQSILLKSFGEGIFNVRYFPTGSYIKRNSAAVILPSEPFKNVYEGNTHDPYRIAGIDPFNIRIHQTPTRIEFLKGNEDILLDEEGFFFHENLRGVGQLCGVRFQLDKEESLYGMGARALNLNLRGKRLFSYNTDAYDYTAGEDDLNISIPFVLSSKGYGIFFDNPRKAYFDLGKTDNSVFEYGVKDSILSYYVILGSDQKTIVERFTRLTGRQPLPPMWTMGYMQSRSSYQNQFEVKRVVEKTLTAGIPLDAVFLDMNWFGGKEKMGSLEWDTNLWPDPTDMVDKFKEKGVHTILLSQPYVSQDISQFAFLDRQKYFALNDSGQTFVIKDFVAGPSALLDVFKPALADWMWPMYQKQIEQGISGWWCDMGEPAIHPANIRHETGTAEEVHNLYAFQWSKLLYEKFMQTYPDRRFFNLQGSGYAGVQRFSSFQGSGEVNRSWEAYRSQIPLMLGSGLSGLAYMHSNIGGYTGGPRDVELYRRWIQLGTFSPIMRVHGSADGGQPEPIFFDPVTKRIAKKAIELRYKLLPYNYSLAFENSRKGLPLARPLMMEIPDDPKSWEIDDQYFWGEALMVAPALKKGEKTREVYFPKGSWFDFYSDSLMQGDTARQVELATDRIPLYVKRGSWIPMAFPVSNTNEFKGDSLELHYYPDPTSEFDFGEVYLDYGDKQEEFIREEFKRIYLTGKASEYRVSAQIKGEGKLRSLALGMNLFMHIHGFSEMPENLKVFGKKLMISRDDIYVYTPGPDTAYWDEEKSTLVIRINWKGSDTLVEVKGMLK